MACQKICKQDRDDITVKVNIQSPIPTSVYTTVPLWCRNGGLCILMGTLVAMAVCISWVGDGHVWSITLTFAFNWPMATKSSTVVYVGSVWEGGQLIHYCVCGVSVRRWVETIRVHVPKMYAYCGFFHSTFEPPPVREVQSQGGVDLSVSNTVTMLLLTIYSNILTGFIPGNCFK